MKRLMIAVHVVVGVTWAGIAFFLACDMAVLGTEETHLERQIGQDRAIRKQMLFERERVQAELDRETQPALIRSAVKKLGLPLQPERRELAGRYYPTTGQGVGIE